MARSTQLVSQHLENISSDALEKYQDIIRNYVRGREGIYALYKRNKLYYVGLARNLRNRLKQHLKDRHSGKWDRFSVYLTVGGDSHIKELESLALRIVKPKGNKVKGKLVRSEDLRRKFRRDIQRKNQSDLDGIFGREMVVEAEDRPSVRAWNTRIREATGGRMPTLAQYIKEPIKLKGHHKGKTIHANVNSTGHVRFNGKVYTSPSLAAAAAVKRPTQNGWTFWHYERGPGDWVPLAKLRR